MASTPRKSLAQRAGAAARKVVSRGAAEAEQVATTAKKAAKKAPGTKAGTKTGTTTAAQTPAKKVTVSQPTAKKAPATKAAAKKTPATKAAAKKAPATKSAAKQTPAKKTAKKTTPTTPAKKTTVTEAPDRTAPAANRAVKKAASKAAKNAASSTPDGLVVLEAEDPWTEAELEQVRVQLEDDVQRLTGELAEVEEDLAGMIENSGEGAGHDQADVGSASFERDQEMVIVNNARDMLEQSGHALERIADGTYGKCEECGNAIGKNRLMAFPRATLCLTCKQREERR